MADRVKDKVVVVTGGAQGIGFGCAEMLAREGARVVIGDRNEITGNAAAAKICEAGGEAVYQPLDVLDEEQCAALMNAAVAQYGRLDGLVNNVGYYVRTDLADMTADIWDTYINLNLRGAMFCCKHALPLMQANGPSNGTTGSIVNVGSIHGIQSSPNLLAYGAAKGGLLTLTRTIAGAYAQYGIRANYLIPGWVMSEGEIALHESMGMPEAELRARGSQMKLGRHQTPQDAAYGVVYLISDESSQVTGTIFNISGGSGSFH